MSKKHFEVLAAAISCIDSLENRIKIAQSIAEVCRQSNPRFHYGMFMKACGITTITN
jgi:chorismate mutase